MPETVKKRVVKDLERAFYPVKQIVPNIQVVHDRMAIEIMRGCKHACSSARQRQFTGHAVKGLRNGSWILQELLCDDRLR